jgi:hypothetical protein
MGLLGTAQAAGVAVDRHGGGGPPPACRARPVPPRHRSPARAFERGQLQIGPGPVEREARQIGQGRGGAERRAILSLRHALPAPATGSGVAGGVFVAGGSWRAQSSGLVRALSGIRLRSSASSLSSSCGAEAVAGWAGAGVFVAGVAFAGSAVGAIS